MKPTVFLLCVASALYLAPSAMADDSYNYTVGTYNVRIATDTEPDKVWADRKDNVARTITDTGFDIVGLTEVIDGEQRSDLQALLPQYDSDYRLVYSGNGKKQMNAVIWKRDRFEALDKGMFYLSPDVNSSSIKFPGASQSRATVWAKLRDKATDEIFYFFCCHMNRIQHADAQREGSRVIARMIRQIAGEYPVFFVGDMNSLPGEPRVAGPLSSVMTSAQEIAAQPASEPLITINFWTDDPVNKYQFDFVYVRHVDVEKCFTVKNFYGKSIAPSDHLPLGITCRLTPEDRRQPDNLYLSEGASIADAVATAAPGATIHLAEGEYHLPEGGLCLGKSVTVKGGYDASFSEISGFSTLKAAQGSRAIEVNGTNFLELRNCIVSGGETVADGGAVLSHGWMLDAQDCIFEANSANRGGALFCEGDIKLTRCGFNTNSASTDASAIYWASGNRAYITDCSACDNDGGMGSTLTLATPSEAALATIVNTSIFDNRGGIVSSLASDGKLNLINCTITANQAPSAIDARSGDLNLHNNLILANSALDVQADAKVSTAYNVYTSASDISFNSGKGDIVGAERENALVEARSIFGEKEAAAATWVLPVLSPEFSGSVINALPNRELNEYAIATDLDNDFRTTTFTYLTHDQRGNSRPDDGTATRGACEYSKPDGIRPNETADTFILEDCRLVDLAGRIVASPGTIDRRSIGRLSGIAPGIYIMVWRGGAMKIRY